MKNFLVAVIIVFVFLGGFSGCSRRPNSFNECIRICAGKCNDKLSKKCFNSCILYYHVKRIELTSNKFGEKKQLEILLKILEDK